MIILFDRVRYGSVTLAESLCCDEGDRGNGLIYFPSRYFLTRDTRKKSRVLKLTPFPEESSCHRCTPLSTH